MPVLELELPYFITYANYTINCIVNNIPTGQTLASGKIMLKRHANDPDDEAVITKTVTPTLSASGQITDTGADTQGGAIFLFSASDTALALPSQQQRYEIGIKFYLSDGQALTFAQCYVRPIEGIIKALA